jgi:fatty acyl-CoA reductase
MGVYKDPLPGYTDNVNGPSGIVAWTVRGYIHTIWGNKNNRANIVPVDYCINAMLVATWDVYLNYENRLKQSQKIPIYNYIFMENNLTWGQYMSLIPLGFHQPLEKFAWFVLISWISI